MQTVPTPGSGKTALLFGALFGVCSGLVQILCISLLPRVGYLLSLLLCAVALLLAGLFASKRTGKVSTGTLAGLWAGLICSVIVAGVMGLLVLVATHDPAFMDAFMSGIKNGMSGSNMPYPITSQQMLLYIGIVLVILGVVWVAVGIGTGAGIGAIGGLIGKSMSPVAQSAQQPYASYPVAQNYSQYPVPPAPAPSAPTPPGQYPYPMNGAPVPPASQQQQANVSYPPPPSYYHEPADQSSSTDVSNPYAEPQQPPYLSPDQQQ